MLTSTCALTLALALQAAPPQPQPQPPPPSDVDRPIHEFFQNLGRDIVALPSPTSALLLGAGTGGALAVHPADDNLSAWADEQGGAGYTGLGRTLGDGWLQGGAALATYGVGVWTDHPAISHVGSDLIRAQALNAVLTRSLKLIAGRKRPSGGGDSLPSGHASAAFASAAVLDSHFGPRVGLPAYVAAGFIGWTRVRDNAHWMSDVLIGGAIGAVVGHTVARGHRQQARTWTVVPAAGVRHVALYVTRTGR